jgi:hypothetical protein
VFGLPTVVSGTTVSWLLRGLTVRTLYTCTATVVLDGFMPVTTRVAVYVVAAPPARTPGPASDVLSSRSTAPPDVIAGSTVGGLVGLLLLVMAAKVMWKKRNRSHVYATKRGPVQVSPAPLREVKDEEPEPSPPTPRASHTPHPPHTPSPAPQPRRSSPRPVESPVLPAGGVAPGPELTVLEMDAATSPARHEYAITVCGMARC